MKPYYTLLLTALAPIIWGSTYYVTTEFLPADYPLTIAMLRALPAGVLLLILVRQLPATSFLPKLLLLGTLNFSLFWWLLFIAAYRLPGGVAATVGAIQPLFVIALTRLWLNSPVQFTSVAGALLGAFGIGVLILTPDAKLDAIGIMAGITGAISMAAGTVLSRRWQPPVSALTFTAWQLMAGGMMLAPFAFWLEPPLPALTLKHVLGMSYLGIMGAAVSYILWFKGIAKLSPPAISALGFLSPVVAVVIGWALLDQHLTGLQVLAMAVVLFSIYLGQQPSVRSLSLRSSPGKPLRKDEATHTHV